MKLTQTRLLKFLLIFLWSVVVVCNASAQSNNATITGTIQDQSGAAIPDATVTATNTGTGILKSSVSDADGRYTILSLPPGFYDVQAAQQGFSTAVQRHEELLVGTTGTMDFTLQVSSVSQTVEVHTEALVATTQSTVSRILDTKELDTLPTLTRNFADLATLTPGVQSAGVNTSTASAGSAAKGGNLLVSIGNSPTYSTGFFVDGITNEGGNQGGEYTALAQDWIQEFSVLALQYPAEYGGAAGGVVNAITRSGTNSFHGRAYDFYQNAHLNSNPAFFTGTTKAPFSSNRVGAMVGGPVMKDKLFFFAGYEHFKGTATTALTGNAIAPAFTSKDQTPSTPQAQLVPWLPYTPTGVVQTANTTGQQSDLAMLKFDYTPNDKNTFTLRSNIDYEKSTAIGVVIPTAFAPSYGEGVSWSRTLSPTSINELRAGFLSKLEYDTNTYCNARGFFGGVGDLQPFQTATPYNYPSVGVVTGPTMLGNPSGVWESNAYTGITTGGFCSHVHSSEVSESLTDTYSLTHGNHDLKFGGSVRRLALVNHNGLNFTGGAYTGENGKAPFNPLGAINGAGNNNLFSPTTPLSVSTAQGNAPTGFTIDFPNSYSLLSYTIPTYAFGMFAQDSWKVRQDLTLNMGLRYDIGLLATALDNDSFPNLASAVPGTKGFIRPGFNQLHNDPLNIAPRFGFAWTPFHNGSRTVIRGGFGIFYDQNDTAEESTYASGNSIIANAMTLGTGYTTNPYCLGPGGTSNCVNSAGVASVPVIDQVAVIDVLAAAMTNYTLPTFPTSTAPCAATNSCTVNVAGNIYTVPALSIPTNPQGGRVDVDPFLKTPGVVQTTVGIQHQFTSSLSVTADFINRYGFHQYVYVNANLVPQNGGTPGSFSVVNPFATTTSTLSSIGWLKANDLAVSVRYRDHRGDIGAIAYQFGYAHDNGAFNFGLSARATNSTDPLNVNFDVGPSFNDDRHILNASGNINIRWGIQFSPIFAYTSAAPLTPTSSIQVPGTALAPAGCLFYYTKCYPAGFGRNSVRGGNFISLNARLSKAFRLGETRSITAYFEGFNLANRANLGGNFNLNVDVTTGANAFLTPTATAVPLRQLQLGAKFDF